MNKRIKTITTIVCLLTCLIFLTGCYEVVSEKPINFEYIPAYDAMETVYEYQYDWYHGDFKLLPNYKMVHHSETYKVQYKITYSDGSNQTLWRTVDKDIFEEAKRTIEEMKGE